MKIFAPTRGPNCLDNVNFSVVDVRTVEAGLSDHAGQLVCFNVRASKEPIEFDRKRFRSITQLGLLDFYNNAKPINWNFVSDENVSMNLKLEKLIDFSDTAFLKSFPETYTRRDDKPKKVEWFDDSLKHMRDMLSFLREVLFRSIL
ncbi:hypothetical protein HHI36_000439 [Cryptolaemus montrouzieri]|uniref:Uncharacterized protein n=1 Tax=Cryptolaemus montrouzieri TaxID=559131 RepID=A0ABD2P533_9CUCU